MKQIQLSSAELEKYGKTATLSNFITQLEAELEEMGQVLCRISVNGMSLEEEDETRLSAMDLSEVAEVTIAVENSAEICSRVLKGWLQTIPQLQEESAKLAEKFRFEGPEGNFRSFADLIDSCRFLVESLVSIREQVGSSLDLSPWKTTETEFRRVVNEVLITFEKMDFVLLADLLEYDFCTVLTDWHKLLAKVDVVLGKEGTCS